MTAAATTTIPSSLPPPPNGATVDRYPTQRRFSKSNLMDKLKQHSMEEYTQRMEGRAQRGDPFTDEELDMVLASLRNVTPISSTVNFERLRMLLQEMAHLSHKDWTRTGNNAQRLEQVLLPNSNNNIGISCPMARQMTERIIMEGNWDGAANYAQQYYQQQEQGQSNDHHHPLQPWAVLVTGVNGIRKTTSIYQPWFAQLLSEALVAPSTSSTTTTTAQPKQEFPLEALPVGSNSFFRQLDHMIATLCNEDFALLYAYTEQKLLDAMDSTTTTTPPPPEIVKLYSDFKAAIFSRYRTLSELLGVILLRQAQTRSMNCMMETSGRDIAMFHYVDQFFASSSPQQQQYNKLALHFTINDLSCAQQSVDARMIREIQTGMQALHSGEEEGGAVPIIYANAGGPYGSEVLPGVQEASDRVWKEVVMGTGTGQQQEVVVGQDWYKATIAIQAHATDPWTAQAVRPDGSLGTVFTFEQN